MLAVYLVLLHTLVLAARRKMVLQRVAVRPLLRGVAVRLLLALAAGVVLHM